MGQVSWLEHVGWVGWALSAVALGVLAVPAGACRGGAACRISYILFIYTIDACVYTIYACGRMLVVVVLLYSSGVVLQHHAQVHQHEQVLP